MSLIGGIIAGAGALAGAIGGARASRKNAKKSIKHQQEENEKTREYNLMLAKYQNKVNRENWNAQNAYNEPKEQVRRMKEAGLNPNLAYDNGGALSQAGAQAGATSGDSAVSADFSPEAHVQTIGDVVNNFAASSNIFQQTANLQSTKDNIEQDTKNKGTENEGQQVKNEGYKLENELSKSKKRNLDEDTNIKQITSTWGDVMAQQSISLNAVQLNLSRQQLTLNERQGELMIVQAEKLNREITNLETSNLKMLSETRNMDAKTAGQRIENAFKSELMQTQIQSIASQTGLNDRKVAESLENYSIQMMYAPSKIAQQEATAELMTQLGVKASYDAGLQKIEFEEMENNKSFYMGMRKVNQIVEAVGGVTKIVSDVMSVTPAGAVANAGKNVVQQSMQGTKSTPKPYNQYY